MRTAWNKGLRKDTDPSVRKISETMKLRRIDNFSSWRDEMKRTGKIKSEYPLFEKNGDLAELIGVVLGDGHIGNFPRTECLRIVSNASNQGFIERYSHLVEKVFNKRPSVRKRKQSNAVDISIYEKNISSRLGIPVGSRRDIENVVPEWIYQDKDYIVRYLRGLYEAEGSISTHKPTYTNKFLFSNRNESMLKNVTNLLQVLDFHPHSGIDKVQISRKDEVFALKELLQFRQY